MSFGELPPSAPLSTSAAVSRFDLSRQRRSYGSMETIPPGAATRANTPPAETAAAAVRVYDNSSMRSAMNGAFGPQANALAQVAVGQLGRVGDVRARRLHAEDRLSDRLKVCAEMDRRFEREDRHLGRLDADMAEHLLVDRLDAAAGEHRRDAALLVGQERHRADAKLGAAVHRARPGEDAAAEPRDSPNSFDRLFACKADRSADAALDHRSFAGSGRRLGRGRID